MIGEWWFVNGNWWMVNVDWWMLIGECWLVNVDWWMLIGECWLVNVDWLMLIGECWLVIGEWLFVEERYSCWTYHCIYGHDRKIMRPPFKIWNIQLSNGGFLAYLLCQVWPYLKILNVPRRLVRFCTPEPGVVVHMLSVLLKKKKKNLT